MPQKEVKTIIFKVTLDNSEAKKQADDLRKDLKAKLKDMESDFSGLKSAAGAVFSGIANIGISAFKSIGNAAVDVGKAFADFTKETIREAADFEEAMLGARKTMNLSAQETKEFGREILNLSTQMGMVDSTTLGNVAITAGTLGLKGKDNIMKFVEAVSLIEKATDLTASVAAEKIPKILTIYQVANEKMGQATMDFGNQIAVLGDEFNATESQILTVAMSIAGTSKTLGMTQQQMLAVSTAIATIETRFGTAGGSFAQVMSKMTADYSLFAEVLQLDSEKLKNAIETNPVEALRMVIDQIRQIGDTQGVVAAQQAIDNLGLSGYKAGEFIKKMTLTFGQVDLALAALNDAQKVNSKLQGESAIQMEGLNAQWKLFGITLDNSQKLLGGPIVEALALILAEGINPIVQGIYNWIESSGFLQNELPRIMANIKIAVMGLVKAFTDWGKSLNWNDILTQLSDKVIQFVTYLQNVDWSGLFTGLTRNLEELWTYFRSEEFSTFATRLKTDLTAAFTYLKENLPTVTEAFKMFFSILEKVVQAGENFSKWMQTFGKIESLSAAKFEEWGSAVSGVFTKAKDALQPLDDAVAQIGWEIVEAGKETTLWVSGASQGTNELTKGVENYIEAVKKAEHETTGNSWLPDLVSWTDKARNDVAGLTSAISQSAQATAQATAQVHELANAQAMAAAKASAAAAAQAQAIVAMNAQGDYIQSNYTTGNVPQGAADVFDARQRIAQKLLPAGQVLFEDGSIGTTAQVQAAQSVQTAASAASSKYGSGIQQIAPGVWSNIAREVDKANAKIAIVGTTLTNVKSEMDSVANTAYEHSLFPDLVSWSDKAAKSISGIVEETRSVNNGFKNVDMGRLMSEAESKSYMASKQGRILSDSESKSYMASKQGVVINYNGMNMIDESSQRRMVAQISNVQKSASSRLVTTR
jgi:TP901 family phage tail tape measure protein